MTKSFNGITIQIWRFTTPFGVNLSNFVCLDSQLNVALSLRGSGTGAASVGDGSGALSLSANSSTGSVDVDDSVVPGLLLSASGELGEVGEGRITMSDILSSDSSPSASQFGCEATLLAMRKAYVRYIMTQYIQVVHAQVRTSQSGRSQEANQPQLKVSISLQSLSLTLHLVAY